MQCFLDCDAVIMLSDEAHHATGGYAYNQVIGMLMCKNPHFRVLALTATPGSTPEALQNLITGLHISHVEIRDEKSRDILPYIHDKVRVISLSSRCGEVLTLLNKLQKMQQHNITMNDDINRVQEILVGMMEVRSVQDVEVSLSDFLQPHLQKLKQSGILFGGDPIKRHQYFYQARCRDLRQHERWASQSLCRLSSLARAMGYLVCISHISKEVD